MVLSMTRVSADDHWPRRVWQATWRITVFMGLWAILLAPGVLWLAPGVLWLDPGAEGGGPLSVRLRLGLEFFGAISILAVAWVLVAFIDRRPFSSLGFRTQGAVRDGLVGLGIAMGMIALAAVLPTLFGWAVWSSPSGFSWRTLGLLATAMILNTITQEVMVRGYLLQTVEGAFGTAWAVAVSTVFFAGLHAGAIVEGGGVIAANLLGAGLLLGLAYVTTWNLWLPLSLHFFWNFIQGPLLGISVTGQALGGGWSMVELDGPAVATGGALGLEGGLFATLATAAGIGAVWWARPQPSSGLTG